MQIDSNYYLEQIKRCCWDCMQAMDLFQDSCEKKVDLEKDFSSLSNFSIQIHESPIRKTDPNFWYFFQGVSEDYLLNWTRRGFYCVEFGEQWSENGKKRHPYALVAADAGYIQGKPISISPRCSIIYKGNGGKFNIFNLGNQDGILPTLKALLEVYKIDPTKIIGISDSTKEFQAVKLGLLLINHEMVTRHFLDYTFCPLIENIRRYRQSTIKDTKLGDNQKNDEEMEDFNAITKLRDIYLAHNIHYPDEKSINNGELVDLSMLFGNYEGYRTLDRAKIYDKLMQSACKCLGVKIDELPTYLKKYNFPIITSWNEITSYLTNTIYLRTDLEDMANSRRAKKREEVLNNFKIPEELHEAINNADRIRCIALHEHFPTDEYSKYIHDIKKHKKAQSHVVASANFLGRIRGNSK